MYKNNRNGSTLLRISICAVMLSLAACGRSIQTDAQALSGLEMISIPAGSFQMGLAGDAKSEPVHTVNVPAFKLAKQEITVGQFRSFVDATSYKTTAEQGSGGNAYGCRVLNSGIGRPGTTAQSNWKDPAFPQTDQQPVVCVSYYDVQEFISWLNKKTSRKFRLPSEAEWEYAAHAGTTTSYPWGDARDEVCRYENTSDTTPNPLADNSADTSEAARSDISPADVGVGGPKPPSATNAAAARSSCSDGYFYTAPVGSFAANPFGLQDMLGNVRERVADCWHENYQGAPLDASVWSAACSKSEHVARGGSWTFQVAAVAGNRGDAEPSSSNDNLGFRLAENL